MRKILFVILASLFFSGCVTTVPDIPPSETFWKEKDKTIGVAVTTTPDAKTHKLGAQGLLDVAINASMASDLDRHLGSIDVHSKVHTLKSKLVDFLKSKGYRIKLVKEPINIDDVEFFEIPTDSGDKHFADKNFTVFKDKYNVDKLLVLDYRAAGTIRSYYGFIPTSNPKGYSQVVAQIINLNTNELEWSQKAEYQVPYETEEWDEPPKYPGLTKALHSAMQQAQDAIYTSIAQ